jgi:acyl carrier protein
MDHEQLRDQRVLQLLSEEADDHGADRIHPAMSLALDLGLAASQRIALAFSVEQEFGIQLDSEHYDSITNHRATVSDVLAAVRCLTSTKETA